MGCMGMFAKGPHSVLGGIAVCMVLTIEEGVKMSLATLSGGGRMKALPFSAQTAKGRFKVPSGWASYCNK